MVRFGQGFALIASILMAPPETPKGNGVGAPVPEKVKANIFGDIFGNIRFSRPTGENKPVAYSDKVTVQHRLALVAIEMGKGSGHYLTGFSIVGLDTPDSFKLKLNAPSQSRGPVRSSLIVVDDDGKRQDWNEYSAAVIAKFEKWSEALAEPMSIPGAIATTADRGKFGIPARVV